MDFYSVLGIGKDASQEEIKRRFRKLASQHHPDKGGDTATFQKIQEAYDTLGDPEKRKHYDNPMPNHNNFGYSHHADINDIFNQFFNHHHRAHNRFNAQFFRTNINVSLKDVYTGSNHMMKIQTNKGIKILDIQIPRGVSNKDQIRYENVIDDGVLIVEFNVLPDLKFERRGNDLYCNQSISVLDLLAGNNFKFETISGKMVEVNLKPKTQPYMNLRLQGHGMPIPNTDSYGDQYILLKPFIPDNIDDEIIEVILRKRTK